MRLWWKKHLCIIETKDIMVRTKQTARKQRNRRMQRAQFLAAVSESGDVPDSLNQTEDTEPEEDTEPRADAVGRTEGTEGSGTSCFNKSTTTYSDCIASAYVRQWNGSLFHRLLQGTWYDAVFDGKFNDQEGVDVADGQ